MIHSPRGGCYAKSFSVRVQFPKFLIGCGKGMVRLVDNDKLHIQFSGFIKIILVGDGLNGCNAYR